MAKRGRPELANAARRTLAFRARPSEVDRLESLIAQSGQTQAEILRGAIEEFLDRHSHKEKTPEVAS